MDKLNLYSELLKAPKNSPVFLSPKLEIDFLLQAYTFGLFPWTSNPVSWWCPDPRCILNPTNIHIQKNIKKELKFYKVKLDFDFLALIKLCAKREKTWIDETFIDVYYKLFKKGYAHSLELYDDKKELVGGIYGLILGKIFFGESMVSARKNASKVALIKLCELLANYDFLIDCQIYNPHLEFMGAKNISRKEFLKLLEIKTQEQSGFQTFKDLEKFIN